MEADKPNQNTDSDGNIPFDMEFLEFYIDDTCSTPIDILSSSATIISSGYANNDATTFGPSNAFQIDHGTIWGGRANGQGEVYIGFKTFAVSVKCVRFHQKSNHRMPSVKVQTFDPVASIWMDTYDIIIPDEDFVTLVLDPTLSGELRIKSVSTTSDGTQVWAVSIDDGVWYHSEAWAPGSWAKVPGVQLTQISVSGDGSHVWGTQYFYGRHNIFYRAGYSGNWEPITGRLMDVAVNEDGSHVWGVSRDSSVHHRAGYSSPWVQIHGAESGLETISVCENGYAWGVNIEGSLYSLTHSPNARLKVAVGSFKFVTVSSDCTQKYAIDSEDQSYIYNAESDNWDLLGGLSVEQVAISNNNHKYGITRSKELFYQSPSESIHKVIFNIVPYQSSSPSKVSPSSRKDLQVFVAFAISIFFNINPPLIFFLLNYHD